MSLAAMRLHSRDEFQSWLAEDLDVREELYTEIGTKLDVDGESLDQLEAWLLEHYANLDAILSLRERGVADAAARHVGRVLIMTVKNAVWEVELDNEEAMYWRLPVVRMDDGLDVCPLTLVTTSLDRRTGTFLHERLAALAEA